MSLPVVGFLCLWDPALQAAGGAGELTPLLATPAAAFSLDTGLNTPTSSRYLEGTCSTLARRVPQEN